MRKLIQGIVDFRKGLTEENRTLFAKLALGQKPDALFVACSDSRVVPNLFASSNPGDLFVLRNIGNLVPPIDCEIEESSAQAALEFAFFSLKIKDIIICGHSECGAMHAICHGIVAENCPHLSSWLQYGQGAAQKVKKGLTLDPNIALHNQISQVNVIQQIEHVMSYPFVREAVEKKLLRIHGWWFDIARADVYCYEPSLNRFVLIDDNEGKLIMTRLG